MRREPTALKNLLLREKELVMTGLLGFVLAGICAVWVLLYGGPVAPDGDVSKAFSFNAALGIFLLSTAAVSSVSPMRERNKVIFRRFYCLLALYGYGAETVQHFRGINPRFVQDGSAFDYAVANIFAVVALLLVVSYAVFAVSYFRKPSDPSHSEIVLGVRYAMIATMLSFAAGIWISAIQSRYTGPDGNIIWLHGFGFHALQALPLIAWLSGKASFTESYRKQRIHLSGLAYLAGLAAIGWQTYLGRPILEWSAFPFLAFGCFFITLAAGAAALINWRRSKSSYPASQAARK